MAKFGERIQHAWNALTDTEDNDRFSPDYGYAASYRQDRSRSFYETEKRAIASMCNRIAVDCAMVSIKHIRQDENDNFLEVIPSGLNECLTTSANIDQTGRALILDAILTMFDEGVMAIVPVDTTISPNVTGGYDIRSLRVGRIIQWYPNHIRVSLYNEKTGQRQEVTLRKDFVAIVENPLYSIMNEPNSTLKRLIRKLNLLDGIDNQMGAGKLDLIIQLPYTIKSEARRDQAENRRKMIEQQLRESNLGIAYTDGTERVTQLNRPVESTLPDQIKQLKDELNSQLGLSPEVFNGTANEATMINYYNRTIDPILSALTDEMRRKFLTKTARTQNQTIAFMRDPFRLVPVSQLAEIADKFTRNEIMTSNEFRGKLGMRPSDSPGANDLRNKNLNPSEFGAQYQQSPDIQDPYTDPNANPQGVGYA